MMNRMKKISAVIITFIMLLEALPTAEITAFAETSQTGIQYYIQDGEVTITGYTGTAAQLVIPDTIEGCQVTKIATGAFQYQFQQEDGITSVILPKTIEQIGADAFKMCTIPQINIPQSCQNIGSNAFYGCSNLTGDISLPNIVSLGQYAFSGCGINSVMLGGNIAAIPDNAFSGCSALSLVNLPDSVTRIGNRAFQFCINLTNITLPQSVSEIGEEAFSMGDFLQGGLAEITLPSGLTKISCGLFENCNNLTFIDLPEDVSQIDGYAFSGCDHLAEITIPKNVGFIGNYAFRNCTGLEKVIYNGTEDDWNSIDIQEGNECLLKVGDYTKNNYGTYDGFDYQIKDQSVIITGYSGEYSAEITVPDSINGFPVTVIGKDSFNSNHNIFKVILPKSITTIDDTAFAFSSLAEIDIPDSVTRIGSSAFELSNLRTITLPESFNVLVLEEGVFYSCGSLQEVNIHSKIEEIGSTCFYMCKELKNISLPDGIKSIGSHAFYQCKSLTEIDLPESCTEIGYAAFRESGLTEIILPQNMTAIGAYAFRECTALTEITIPKSMKMIGSFAFSGCNHLTTVYYNGTQEMWEDISIDTNNNPLIEANIICKEAIQFTSNGIILDALEDEIDADAKLYVASQNIEDLNIRNDSGFTMDKAEAYNIYFEKDGQKIQPSVAITVSIPVPTTLDGEKCKVFYIDESGSLTDMNAVYREGYMVFITDHFSYYAVVQMTDVMYGDANNDQNINLDDVVILAQYVAEWDIECNEAALDVNGDGTVNLDDIVHLAQYVAEWEGIVLG